MLLFIFFMLLSSVVSDWAPPAALLARPSLGNKPLSPAEILLMIKRVCVFLLRANLFKSLVNTDDS